MFAHFFRKITALSAGVLSLSVPVVANAQSAPAAVTPASTATPASLGFHTLDAFGPIKTAAECDATYKKAMAAIQSAGGGVLVIPAAANADWKFINNTQGSFRVPEPPAPANKAFGITAGVTVIDSRGGTVKIHPPQMSGMMFQRTMNAPEGQSSPHWEYHPMLNFQNNVIRGSTSYMDFLAEDVQQGQDRRFYMPSIRGLFPGMFINAHEGPMYGGGVQRLYLKSLGYDKEKKMSYFVADTEMNHKKTAVIHNKTHVNVLKMETNAHTELQSFDVMNERNHYSQGDSYLYNATFNYMGNVHSAAGDENGVLYAAFVRTESNSFKGKVASANAEKGEVVFTPNSLNASTLGSGRPLINMNPKKWVTGGSVHIVRPASYWKIQSDDPSMQNPVFQGKTYPTQITKDEKGLGTLTMGGLIQSTADAPWTADIVGRYFAVNVKNENIPVGASSLDHTGRLRWYRITSFKQNPDNTKEIRIERFWWGSKEAGSPTLYHDSNYSSDGNLKPLAYIIAPGSNVYDVSRAALDLSNKPYDGGASPRTLLIAPYVDGGTTMDFEAGDDIQQAIGPDPFHPIPFRAWTWDQVPGAFPSPIFDVANYGVTRASVLSVMGGNSLGVPAWESVIDVSSNSGTVLDIAGKVSGAAIRIAQPTKPAPITWMYDGSKKAANLVVDQKGKLTFDGNGANISGGITTLGGISGTAVEARNLRGIGVTVVKGLTTVEVKFPRAEDDGDYAVFVETSWLSQRAITTRTPQGFTVTFATAAPENARLDWTLVR